MRQRNIGSESECRLLGNAAVVDLKWKMPADLDLGIVCEGEQTTLVYFGNEGRRTSRPYAHLAHQSDGTGRVKTRREHAVLTRLTGYERYHIFVWDHDAVTESREASFLEDPDSFSVSVTDRTNLQWMFERQPAKEANCALVGVIENGRAENRWITGKLSGEGSKLSELCRIASGDDNAE